MIGSTDPWHAEAIRSRPDSPATRRWDMSSKPSASFPRVPSFPFAKGTPTIHQPNVAYPERGTGLTVGLSNEDLVEFGPAEKTSLGSEPFLESTLSNTSPNPPGPPTTPHPENRDNPMESMMLMMKGMEEWKEKALSDLKEAARSRTASRASSVHKPLYFQVSKRKRTTNHRHRIQ